SFFSQCSVSHIGDILVVDNRLLTVTRRQSNFPGKHRFQEKAFTKVLAEPGTTQDRPVCTGLFYGLLCPFGSLLASTGKKYHPADSVLGRPLGKRFYCGSCTGHR